MTAMGSEREQRQPHHGPDDHPRGPLGNASLSTTRGFDWWGVDFSQTSVASLGDPLSRDDST